MNCFQKTNRDLIDGIKALTVRNLIDFLIFVSMILGIVGYVVASVFFFQGYLEVGLFTLAGAGSMLFIVTSASAFIGYIVQLQINCEKARKEAE